jgi:hypothetical protein
VTHSPTLITRRGIILTQPIALSSTSLKSCDASFLGATIPRNTTCLLNLFVVPSLYLRIAGLAIRIHSGDAMGDH